MENFLELFDKAIKKQAQLIGSELALSLAKKAGLGISVDGHIVSCVGNPQVVLLRLIKNFASTGNIEALSEITALINEVVEDELLEA